MVDSRWFELAWIEHDEGKSIRVSLPEAETVTYLHLLESQTVRELLARLGWQRYSWSVFGKSCPHQGVVKAGDRIELLPALRSDAKTARRRRAAHKRQLNPLCKNP